MAATSHGDNKRDAGSLRVLGLFFGVLGGIVLLATFWALDKPPAAIVNAISGVVLLAVGLGMSVVAKRMAARHAPDPAASQKSSE